MYGRVGVSVFVHRLNECLLPLEWLVGVHSKEAHESLDRDTQM